MIGRGLEWYGMVWYEELEIVNEGELTEHPEQGLPRIQME